MDFSRRFDMAAGALVFLVFLATVYLTKDFLTTILLSIVLVFLLKPLYPTFRSFSSSRNNICIPVPAMIGSFSAVRSGSR